MNLMGVDVGYSEKRRTTGIACLDGDGPVVLAKAGTSPESREELIPKNFRADFIAIDGPLLPQGATDDVRRRCESIFIRAPFWNRCKPGMSHFGSGLKLRHASKTVYEQVGQFLTDSARSTDEGFVTGDGSIVEAFPNAFLCVLLPEDVFCAAPKPKPRKRFDWLYEHAVQSEALKALSKEVGLPDKVWNQMMKERDHEKRAALVCLLTAALAAKGTAYRVGDTEGGWFWLPPLCQWQEWARRGIQASESLPECWGSWSERAAS